MSFEVILERMQGSAIKIRVIDLVAHPSSRSLDPIWLEKLRSTWGSKLHTIDRVNHPIMVMSMTDDSVPTSFSDDPLSPIENVFGRKWYIIGGQHRVEVLLMAIRQQLEEDRATESSTPISDEEVLAHPEAYWIAITYSNGSCLFHEHSLLSVYAYFNFHGSS